MVARRLSSGLNKFDRKPRSHHGYGAFVILPQTIERQEQNY